MRRGRQDMSKLIIAFRNTANAPKTVAYNAISHVLWHDNKGMSLFLLATYQVHLQHNQQSVYSPRVDRWSVYLM